MSRDSSNPPAVVVWMMVPVLIAVMSIIIYLMILAAVWIAWLLWTIPIPEFS